MKDFFDSSMLIEFEKSSQTELFEAIFGSEHHVFINPIVVSEYLYQLLGILGGRSPMSICESGKIMEVLSLHDTQSFLSGFELLPIPDAAVFLSIEIMKKYNLLPNDAIIVSSCKIQEVSVLASYDSDFSNACKAEGIRLIANIADWKKIA